MLTRAMPSMGRTLVAALICFSAMRALGVTAFTFTPLEVSQPRAITPDVIAAINGRQVFFLDAAFQKMGFLRLDGGPPVIVPLPAGPGERYDAEDAVDAADFAIWSIGQLKNQDGTERSVIARIPYDLSGIAYFNIPTSTACSASTDCDMVAAPDGRSFFFTETREAKIGRIDLNGVFAEYPVLVNDGRTSPNILAQIAVGMDGKICATAPINNSVVCMTPQGGAMTDIRIGPGRNFVAPNGIVGHPNGNMYFTTDDVGVGQLTPTGVVTEYALPTANSDPVDIAVGADDVLYLVQPRAKQVAQFNPVTKDVLEVAITNGDTPTDIVTVPGATAETTELVINGYNASFDYTPQKLTVEKTDTPPDDPPELTIEKFPPSGGVELDPDRDELAFRIGSAVEFQLVLTNNSKTVPAGGWTIRDFIPAGLEQCFGTATLGPTLPLVIENVAGFIKITPQGEATLPAQGKLYLRIYCRVAATGLITNIADVTAPGMTPARGSARIVGLTSRELERLEEQRARTDVRGRP